MSVTIDYFFNSDKPIHELAADINRSLGCSLAPYQGDPAYFFTRFLGMEFSLSAADDYVDDGEMEFSRYGYQIGFRTPMGGAASRPVQLPGILVVIYELHRWLSLTGMLVFDVQILLARYDEREIDGYGKRLFDAVSSAPFVSFAAHLTAVSTRLPHSWREFYSGE